MIEFNANKYLLGMEVLSVKDETSLFWIFWFATALAVDGELPLNILNNIVCS